MADETMQSSSSLWGWLRGGKPLQTFILVLLFLLLLGCIVLQGRHLFFLYQEQESSMASLKLPRVNVSGETERLRKEEAEFRQVMLYRRHSREYAGVVLAIGREPYRADTPGNPSLSASQAFVPVPEILPPYMVVRAIFIVGPKGTAIMDIDGDGAGLVVEKGYAFGGGLGKVLKITKNEVVVLWAKEKITVPLVQ